MNETLSRVLQFSTIFWRRDTTSQPPVYTRDEQLGFSCTCAILYSLRKAFVHTFVVYKKALCAILNCEHANSYVPCFWYESGGVCTTATSSNALYSSFLVPQTQLGVLSNRPNLKCLSPLISGCSHCSVVLQDVGRVRVCWPFRTRLIYCQSFVCVVTE